MVRVTTSNYGAETVTQFAWATDDNDQFDRVLDLAYLAQALEGHTHAATRGLAVARVATGAVDAAAIAGLAVGTAALANLSVTNAKLAAGAVTMDKITIPLVQATDNFVGGFRLRDSTNTYQVGYYIAANGLAVFGAGPIAGISTGNLILGQAGQVSVGPVQGAGKFNVVQTATGSGTGITLYHSNQVHKWDFNHDTTGRLVIGCNGTDRIHVSAGGYITIGPTAQDTGRLYVLQAAGTSTEGLRLNWGGGFGYAFVIDSGAMVLQSATTAVQIESAAQTFSPATSLGASLGSNTFRWSKVWTQDLDVSGTVTGAGSFPLNGVVWFPTLANLTSAGASWARYTTADGRLLVGAGTTFGQTFTTATGAYGANWTPVTGLSSAATGVALETFPVQGGATQVASAGHTHAAGAINGQGAAWLPPMQAGIWGQRIS